MFGLIFHRSIHITRTSMSVSKTSSLAKLRKSTGFPLTNCKKALEMFPEDFAKAEEWLHAEAKSKGWSKWAKIQTRTATQGLIGVCSKNNIGVMLEINCETDFVSRNAEFQQVVEKMLSGCLSYAANLKLGNEISKTLLDEPQLSAIPCGTSTLGELVVSSAMKFNEKTVAKRAVFLKVPEDVLLNSLTHPAVECPDLEGAKLGKYGVLLASTEKKNSDPTEDISAEISDTNEEVSTEISDTKEDISTLRLNLCQHIIGMNPLSIGQLTDKDIAKFLKQKPEGAETSENVQCEQITDEKIENIQTDEKDISEKSEDSEDSQAEELECGDSGLKESDETELLFQTYLLNPKVTVGETLFKTGIEIIAFERFECGETAEEASDVAVAASG